MASEIRTKVKIDGDASQAKKEVDALNNKINNLYKEMKSINNSNTKIDSKQLDIFRTKLQDISTQIVNLKNVTDDQLSGSFKKIKDIGNIFTELKGKVSDTSVEISKSLKNIDTSNIDNLINKIKEMSSNVSKQARHNWDSTRSNRTPFKDAGTLNSETFKQSTQEVLNLLKQYNLAEVDNNKIIELSKALDEYLNKLKELKKYNRWADKKDTSFYDSIISQYNLLKTEIEHRNIKVALTFDYNLEDTENNIINTVKNNINNELNDNDLIPEEDIDISKFDELKMKLKDFAESNKDVSDSLLDMAESGNVSENAIAGLISTLIGVPLLGKIIIESAKANVKNCERIIDTFKKCVEDSVNVLNVLGEAGAGAFNFVVDGISEFVDIADEAIQKFKELADGGIELQQGYFTLYNYLGTAGDEIVAFTENLQDLYNTNSDELVSQLRGVLGMVSNMNLELAQSNDMIKAFTSFGQDLSAFSGMSVEETIGQLESAVNLGLMRANSPIVRALDLTKEDVEMFRELNTVEERAQFLLARGEKVRGNYAKWLETSAGKVEQYNNAYSNLMNSISRLATGLFAKIAPLLTNIIRLIEKAVDGLAKILNIDLKGSADNQAVEYYDSVAGSLDSVAESAEKAERKTASFDDVIQITDSKSSGSGEAGGISDFSFLDNWLNDNEKKKTEWDRLYDNLRELWKHGDYEGFGKEITDFFGKKLAGIDWDTIQNKVSNLGTTLAEIMNGLTNKRLFGTIGKTLAESLNTGFEFLYSYASTYDFSELGKSIKNAWNKFWTNLDTSTMAGAVSSWFWGLVDTIHSMLGDTSMGETLGNLVNDFFLGSDKDEGFSSERMDKLADTIIGSIDTIFANIDKFLETVNQDEVKVKILDFIKKLIKKLGEKTEDWGSTIGDLLTSIFTFITEAVQEADNAGLITAIQDFIDGLGLNEILGTWLLMQIQILWEKIKIALPSLLQTLASFIILGPLGIFANLIGQGLGDLLIEKLETAWVRIKNFFSLEKWKKLGSDALNGLFAGLKEIFNKIKSWYNTNIADKLSAGITVPSWIPVVGGQSIKFDVPRLATGGIVTSSTFANIGEAGAEGVFPLTGAQGQAWMNVLADKIASKLNNSTGGSSITIDMSSYQKNFYTRAEMIEFGTQIVEALKVCGVNLQVAY